MAWRQILVENKAQIIQRGITPLGEEFIYRQFPAISIQQKDDCVLGLKGYTSTKNANASSFVTDPVIDGEVQAGVWYGGEIVAKYDTPVPANPAEGHTLVLVQLLIRGLSAAVKAAVTTERSCRWTVTRTEFRSMVTFPTVPAGTAGVSYRFVDARLDDKSALWSGFLETRTQTEQEITEFKATVEPFRTVEQLAKIGIADAAAAALIPATQTAGKRVSVAVERNENCTVDLRKTTETGVPGTRKTTTIEAGDVKIVDVEDLNQVAAIAAPTAEAGKIKQTTDVLNELARHDHNTRTEEAKDQSIAMPAAYTDAGNVSRTKNQESRIQILSNAAAAPTPLLTGEYGEVRYQKNRFDLYDGYKTLLTYLEESEIPGWLIDERHVELNYLERAQRGKKRFRRVIVFDCYINQVSQKNTAYTKAFDARTGKGNALQGTEVGSSRVEVLQNGQYRAFWIGNRRLHPTLGTWTTDGDLPI